MSKSKVSVRSDPSSDLELELERMGHLAELMIEAWDRNNSDHVGYLAELLPAHVGKAQRAYRALHGELFNAKGEV